LPKTSSRSWTMLKPPARRFQPRSTI